MAYTQPDFSKFFAALPGVNFDALAAAQQRNFDALVQVGQVVASGAQAIWARQAAAFEGTLKDGVATSQAAFAGKDLQAGLHKQFDFVTAAQQKAVALATELTGIAQKTSQDAFEVLRKRAEEGAAELRTQLKVA